MIRQVPETGSNAAPSARHVPPCCLAAPDDHLLAGPDHRVATPCGQGTGIDRNRIVGDRRGRRDGRGRRDCGRRH